jgi:general secretion pathway protein G
MHALTVSNSADPIVQFAAIPGLAYARKMAGLIKFPTRRVSAKRGAERGISLLEILVALTIIALVTAIVGPRLMGQLDRSKSTAARIQVRALVSALETMRLDIGRYPSAQEGLTLLVRSPSDEESWAGPYLDAGLPLDPWDRPFLYEPPANPEGRPRVGSLGADGAAGGSGTSADVFIGGADQAAEGFDAQWVPRATARS